MLTSSQLGLCHAVMCWDTYIPETTRGRLSTYTGQLDLAGSSWGGDNTGLVAVVVVYSPVAVSSISLNLLLSCYTTKCIADPWQGAAYARPSNSGSSPTVSLLCLALCYLLCIGHPCWHPACCWEGRPALEMLMAISHAIKSLATIDREDIS